MSIMLAARVIMFTAGFLLAAIAVHAQPTHGRFQPHFEDPSPPDPADFVYSAFG
jgi:hypothetical protein